MRITTIYERLDPVPGRYMEPAEPLPLFENEEAVTVADLAKDSATVDGMYAVVASRLSGLQAWVQKQISKTSGQPADPR